MPSPLDPLSAPKSRFRAIQPVDAVLYAFIAFGCVLRIYNVIAHNPIDHLWSDPLRHWAHAREPLTPSPMALFDQPVFQMWLSLVQKFTMGLGPLIAVYASALSIITPWCWYRFLRETLTSKTLALAGWAALALLPTWIGIYSYFMSETLFLPTLGVSLWMTMRAKRRQTLESFLTMVACWTFCGLTRGIGIPLAGVAALWVWLWHPCKLRTALWSALMITVVLAPLSYRNYYYVKLWAPQGNGWLNKIYAESGAREIQIHLNRDGAVWLYGFGSPSIDTHPLAPFSNWTSQRTGVVDVTVDLNNGEKDWKASYEKTAKHGAERWRLHFENLVFLFFGNSWPDNNPEYFMGWLANLSRWIWAPAFILILALAVWRAKDVCSRPLLPLVIATGLFFQGWLLLVPNEGRYRKPYEGLLIAQLLVLADLSAASRRAKNPATPESISTSSQENSTLA
jgi:4-amino-4-deoxy-L-arabinose transferase-like glycosyltransferase